MLRNYLKVTFRNLLKHRVYSFINIFGLAIGISACLLIFLFISHELSFDKFHSKSKAIYRLDEVQSFNGMAPQNVALSMSPMGPNLAADYPEILNFTRFAGGRKWLCQVDEKEMFIEDIAIVDSTFFKIFDFELLHGDPETSLDEPNSILLTETTAKRFFNKSNLEEIIGQQIKRDQEHVFKVTGILKDVPKNSHLQFNSLVSFSTIAKEEWVSRWGSNWLVTYLVLEDGVNIAALEEKFPGFLSKYIEWEEVNDAYKLYLQEFEDVHLGSMDITHDYQNFRKFNGDYIYIFSILAIFVLVIASINFMNLSTARSVSRSSEVGVRKSIGATKGQLVFQFLGESVIMVFLAFILAISVASLVLPSINEITQRELSLNYLVANPFVSLVILLVVLFTGILSGAYPALFISSFQPATVLKGKISGIGKKSFLRNTLVVIQFTIAIGMIVGTILALQQLDFMRNRNIGLNKSQVVLIPLNETANKKYKTLKGEIIKTAHILNATASGQRLGNNIHQSGVKFKGDSIRDLAISTLNVDYNFLSFYEIELEEGREFKEEITTDLKSAYVINESLAAELAEPDLVGKNIGYSWEDTLGSIIGVAKDFNYNSLHHEIVPLAMSVQDWGFDEMSVKVDEANSQAAIQDLEKICKEMVPDRPFEYSFLDEHFENLYQTDQQVSKVISIIAGLAILIACLGLFGLASISTEQRTKEIGIRKVMGASIFQLIMVLSKSFAILVIIAFFIAAPITYYLMENWLQDFAYRININLLIFLLAGFLAFLIAMVTVSYRAIQASIINPVDSLRYE
ncbi:ABC transporter permease [Flexithrix dorotheae]|uniref:ABC transporter permease n=1 Tax=Flexithrix dorotheae TaxID=70993 RepID=UPI000370AB6C|nr:ABC transporter permease [Flexithrix dorotheae]